MKTTATVKLSTTGVLTAEDFVTHPSGFTLQVCRAEVRLGDVTLAISLFTAGGWESPPVTLDSLATIIANEPAGSVGVLVGTGAAGRVAVEAHPDQESAGRAIAAAAAVMKASWGWDESPTISVSVNERVFPVAPQFVAGVWTATLDTVPAAPVAEQQYRVEKDATGD